MILLKVANKEDIQQGEFLLFEEDKEFTNINLEQWGAYFLATAKTKFRKTPFQQSTLMGYPNNKPYAIYLADNNQPLSIAGNTKLVGKSFLPKRGIKRAYIEGRSYSGRNLLEGTQKQSGSKIPQLNNQLKSYLATSIRKGVPNNIDYLIDFQGGDYLTKQQSFQDSTLCYYSKKSIQLLGDSLVGRIVVKSESEIYLGNESFLENILLIAPKVTIESGFTGVVHIVASDTITLEPLVSLEYPSSLLLSAAETTSSIFIGQGCDVKGEIVLQGQDNYTDKGLITISENVKITGNVYSFDKVELKGQVEGSVTCSKFSLRTSSSIYENHILNGSVNSNELPKQYLGTQWDNSVQVKEVVKWLD